MGRHALARGGTRVLVAVSGGADSVALLHVLLELERAGDLALAGVAHFNHQLRGADSDADETFCRDLAASLGLPIETGRGDVRASARESGRSLEDAARQARYAFFEEAADRLGADAIAVGHTRDDQAETFLLRLIRGSGPRGLAAILPRAGRVIRPLLEVPRDDLRLFAAERGLVWREDATNEDRSIPRNRVRHELIPYLAREFSPGITDVLSREAAIARDDEDHLHREAIDFAASIVLRTTGRKIRIDAAALRALHPAVGARVARYALSLAAPSSFIGFEHVARLLQLAAEDSAEKASVSLPGQQAVRTGDVIVLAQPPSRRGGRGEESNSFRVPLSIPGEVTLDKQGWAVSAEPAEAADWPAGPRLARAAAVTVAAGALSMPLAVRSRRPGDRFRPLGMEHRKKLQDFLVDRKIPKEMRDTLPLVVDADDRIVWVVGESVAEDFRVTEGARGVLLLKARRLGGLG